VKQPEPKTLDDIQTDALVAVCLARRRHAKDGMPPPLDGLAAFSYAELISTARARLPARVLNRKILGDAHAFASVRSTSRAQ
jgi:hypothetical protein